MREDPPPKFDKIMIIDDTNIDLYITSRIITRNNFGNDTLEYTSAEAALIYLQNNQENIPMLPRVILVDIYMPMMSGFEFMEAYNYLSATVKNYCKVYIISSTNYNPDIIRVQDDKNVVDFQEKPVTKKFLENISA